MRPSYRCWAEIDLNALRENLAWLRHRVGPDVKIITVVKADAYGHGLKQIAALLMQSGTDVFGVANLGEARNIRSVGPGWPILMLGACLPEEVELAVRDEVMPTVSTLSEAKSFSAAATRLRRQVLVHVKVDTGMGRLGVSAAEAPELIREVSRLPGVRVHGVFTHYASVEDSAPFSALQREQFRRVIDALPREIRGQVLVHVNNSGALLLEPKSSYNAVRPGLLVYGVLPPGTRRIASLLKSKLRPALSWKTRVSLVKEVAQDTALSYGGSFVTRRRMRIATVTAGYGDGYFRAGSNRARVLIGGRRCPVVGRITMDQMLVDVSRVPGVQAGDEVVLIGRQGDEEITAGELGGWCGTVAWEVFTNITYRVPRLYLGGHAA